MKRIFSMLAVFFLSLALAGCGSDLPLEETGPAPQITSADPEVITEEPPLLRLTGAEFQVVLDSGNYSWYYSLPGGERKAVLADGLHPSDSVCWERLAVNPTADSKISLEFDYSPDSIKVWCYGEGESVGMPLAMDGNQISLAEGRRIYHIHAAWQEGDRSCWGEADYLLLAEYHAEHTAAAQPQTVENPITGYCGNIVTTVFIDGKEFSFMYEDSVAIADILLNLDYDAMKICRCIHEFEISIDGSQPYEISLTNAFARCEDGQASLTEDQVGLIRQIVDGLR